jgi:BlaI family transcriptional regulator, penicillinase repressor
MRISPAEYVVMEALWRASPLAADEVGAALGPDQGWSETTVKTLLARLVKKKAVSASRDGRRYLYAPLIAREAYVRDESRNLIDRLFDGQLAPFVSNFAQTNGLSPEDIAALKRLVEELDDDA